MKRFLIGALCLALLGLATGCGPGSFGQQGRVAMADKDARVHHKTKLTINDFRELASNITNQMLASPVVRSWGKKKPMLMIGVPANTTDDDNLRANDMQDAILETVVNSGVARVAAESPLIKNFDYIVKSSITSTSQRDTDGRKTVEYRMTMFIFTPRGERVGQWSDFIILNKAARPLL